MFAVLLAVLLAVSGLARPTSAQDTPRALTLQQAVAQADRQAYGNRIVDAAADDRVAQALAPYRGILPTLRVEASVVRTTDPIAAFGTTLRQRAITPADFDPTRLNFPAAVGNRGAALVIEQPLLNADAWVGRRAARAAADAQVAVAEWTRRSTRTDVVRAYYGATLAAEKAATLRVAERAATAHVLRASALADTGLVTRSDALLAEVKAGEVMAQRLAAEADALHAARALAVLLGSPQSAPSLPAALPATSAIVALVATDTADAASADGAHSRAEVGADGRAAALTDVRVDARANARANARADVRAADAAYVAARADARRAQALYLPRLNGFARYDWNDRSGFFQNDRSWTAGVMATWTPFAGASELGEVRGTAARARSAAAQRDAAVAQAALTRAESRGTLQVALAQLDIAERAVAQAAEAHRVVARKYDGGLATISDLLEAAAIETQVRLAHAFARYHLLVTAASRRQALGGDPAYLVALDAATPSPDRAPR